MVGELVSPDMSMPADQATEDLEARIRAAFDEGNLDGAVSAAIEGYGPELLGFLVNLLQDQASASEVFSQACEDMWTGIRSFQWRSHPLPSIHAVELLGVLVYLDRGGTLLPL